MVVTYRITSIAGAYFADRQRFFQAHLYFLIVMLKQFAQTLVVGDRLLTSVRLQIVR